MAVTDIDILDGSQSAKEGWEKDKHDLNKEAKGDYLYLTWERDGTKKPVTDLCVVAGKDKQPPPGYYRIGTDLNQGTPHGEHLYLCFSREGTKPILELAVVLSGDQYAPAPEGFTRYEKDLNKGADGEYVYLCYRRQE
ncbi:hypothetical protein [Streptomyces sp. NRRL S-495]|uniref:hypothetical protein n=1 Tax=Streptomyces sp. NRRL S-495 TaxID=1609133 RepID=UPI0005F914E6|nr:hypothetical protein [Streptomyces sp. NRRL S-495]KJY36618.1 hypothetical protein VR45_10875 [Streptomyces sp. NRRL S-495]